MTHPHLDHVAGLIDGAGGARFPNAELVINAAERGFWADEAALRREVATRGFGAGEGAAWQPTATARGRWPGARCCRA